MFKESPRDPLEEAYGDILIEKEEQGEDALSEAIAVISQNEAEMKKVLETGRHIDGEERKDRGLLERWPKERIEKYAQALCNGRLSHYKNKEKPENLQRWQAIQRDLGEGRIDEFLTELDREVTYLEGLFRRTIEQFDRLEPNAQKVELNEWGEKLQFLARTIARIKEDQNIVRALQKGDVRS